MLRPVRPFCVGMRNFCCELCSGLKPLSYRLAETRVTVSESFSSSPPQDSGSDAPRWRLWIDGCGGFLMLTQDEVSVGGWRPDGVADISVKADWPRRAGSIVRSGDDYFWTPAQDNAASTPPPVAPSLISDGQPLPVSGTAAVTVAKPSGLSSTAVVQVAPPHRFDGHVDSVLLVRDTVLIGNGRGHHIRHREEDELVVLVWRSNHWRIKSGVGGDFQDLALDQRYVVGSLAMTMEQA